MHDDERRRMGRLLLEVPVQLELPTAGLKAATRDVSRGGLCVRVPCRALAMEPGFDLAVIAAQVAERLRAPFGLRLLHPDRPVAVARSVRVMRIALPLDAPDSVELGLVFDRPLQPDDLARLGLALPPMRTTRAPAPAPAPAEPVVTEPHPVPEQVHDVVSAGLATGARQAYRAYLSGTGPDAPPSLLCHSDAVSREAVRVRAPREELAGDSASDAVATFAARFGTHMTLKLMDVHQHIWTGPVRLCAVELPSDRPAEMQLTLAFDRRLRPAELRRLQLDRGAA